MGGETPLLEIILYQKKKKKAYFALLLKLNLVLCSWTLGRATLHKCLSFSHISGKYQGPGGRGGCHTLGNMFLRNPEPKT